MRQTKRLSRFVFVVLLLPALLPHAWAAPVTDISDPGTYSAPTAAELAVTQGFLDSIPSLPAGSFISGLRDAPTTLVNPGLDALAPPQLPEAQHNEVAGLHMPSPSRSCPGNTPVTITVSGWTVEMTGRTLPGAVTFGLGTLVIDSRNPSAASPVSLALTTVLDDLDVGGPNVAPPASYVATFADLPFYSAATVFDVAISVEIGGVWEVSRASYNVTDTPSITYEYDDTSCGAGGGGAAAVPLLGPAQLLLLLIFLAGSACLFLDRRGPSACGEQLKPGARRAAHARHNRQLPR